LSNLPQATQGDSGQRYPPGSIKPSTRLILLTVSCSSKQRMIK
jgi:hypothetical protein